MKWLYQYIAAQPLLTILLSVLWISTVLSQLPQFRPHYFQSDTIQHGVSSSLHVGIGDINGDLLDDIVISNQGRTLHVYYQMGVGKGFIKGPVLPVSHPPFYTLAIADFDANYRADIFLGNYHNPHQLLLNPAYPTFQRIRIPADNTYPQSIAIADYDHNGWLDIFIANDIAANTILFQDSAASFRKETSFLRAPEDFLHAAGNYGVALTDVNGDHRLDLYIAKCFPGENDTLSPLRLNQLYLQDSTGSYVLDSTNQWQLQFGAQSWTANFGDLDNDGDFDALVTHHDRASYVLENTGNHFVRREHSANIHIDNYPIQSVLYDIDNNGYLDIIIGGFPAYIYLNFGNWQFRPLRDAYDLYPPSSLTVGDLNNDGFADILTNHYLESQATLPDRVFFNSPNDNHFIRIRLIAPPPNTDAIGSIVRLKSGGQWQLRLVESGIGYGIANSTILHFGLGSATIVDSLIIYWHDGDTSLYTHLQADGTWILHKRDTQCAQFLPQDDVITYDICPGDSVVLSIPRGAKPLYWSGLQDTTATVTVRRTANYRAFYRDSSGCLRYSPLYVVRVNPVWTPEVSLPSPTHACRGTELTAIRRDSNLLWWNALDVDTLQISRDTSLWYSYRYLCTTAFSDTLHYQFYPTPSPPPIGDTVDDSILDTLIIDNDSAFCQWYTSDTSVQPFFTGDTLHLSSIPEQIHELYVRQCMYYPLPDERCGLSLDALGKGGYHVDHKNVSVFFEVFETLDLIELKTYADKAGPRRLLIYDASDSLVWGRTYDIQSGLNALPIYQRLTPGTYRITTDTTTNLLHLGTKSPQLLRHSNAVIYPLQCSSFLRITHTDLAQFNYYYFYDWKVAPVPLECCSERKKLILKRISTSNKSVLSSSGTFQLYPNPLPYGHTLYVQWDDSNAPLKSNTLHFDVRDIYGKVLQSGILHSPSHRTALPVQLPSAGTYIVSLHAQGKPPVSTVLIVLP